MQERLVYGRSKSFCDLVKRVDEYAHSSWPVLIHGESGVGKELIAERLHRESRRANKSFIPLNCGALPPALFESELFGHERGAFSGAVTSSKGMVRAAHQGTLFLDEIGELELSLQAKLLRVIERGEVRMVGATRVEKIDVRIISATNVDLYASVRKRTFRWDLLTRLSVFNLWVPPLRERKEDLLLIAEHLLGESASLSAKAAAYLLEFDWPGNVRQLRNVLVRAAVNSNGKEIKPGLMHSLLNEERRRSQGVLSFTADSWQEGSLANNEKQVILATLKRWKGNRKEAAKELGIARSTLQEKIKKWSQEDSDSVPSAARAVGNVFPPESTSSADGEKPLAVRAIFSAAASYRLR